MDLLTIAKGIADRAEAESAKENVPVAVTVIDTHGNVVLTHRMIGAPAFSLELAERKAYTSALIGMRTADLVPLVQPGAELYPLLAVSGGRYSAMGTPCLTDSASARSAILFAMVSKSVVMCFLSEWR